MFTITLTLQKRWKTARLHSLRFLTILKREDMAGAIGNAKGVDLNRASREELERVGGLGPDRAQRIVQQRPIRSWEDLKKIEGFSDTLVEGIKKSRSNHRAEGSLKTFGGRGPISGHTFLSGIIQPGPRAVSTVPGSSTSCFVFPLPFSFAQRCPPGFAEHDFWPDLISAIFACSCWSTLLELRTTALPVC